MSWCCLAKCILGLFSGTKFYPVCCATSWKHEERLRWMLAANIIFFEFTSQWCDRFWFFKPHFHSAHPNKKRLKSVSSLSKYLFRYSFWSLIKREHPLLLYLCFSAVSLCMCFSPFRSVHFFFLYFWRIMLSCLRWWRRHECIYSAIWILRYSSKCGHNISLYLLL